MNKHLKTLSKILRGNADANIPFRDLCHLLVRLGFEYDVTGGHHIFRHASIPERIVIQPLNSKGKKYQVRQIRQLIVEYQLLFPNTEQDHGESE